MVRETLRRQIETFAIDDGQPALTFARRLARENGWSGDFAERVIIEYKRFLFLACTADHPVTPSEEVDQAWHLHLTYTRSYWDHLCAGVLGRPLHHDPTRGGSDEDRKYHQQYERTLRTYEKVFGEPPPVDIWPPVETRFASGPAQMAGGRSRLKLWPHAIACVIAGVLTAWGAAMMEGNKSDHGQLLRAESITFIFVVGIALFAFILWLIRKFGGGGGRGGGGWGCGGGCGSSCGGGCGGGGCGGG